MESPDQVIIHVNSHGPRAIANPESYSNNAFRNYTAQPVKDINRVGLQYASLPRQMDVIRDENRDFQLLIEFTNSAGMQRTDDNYEIRCGGAMPRVNYYPGGAKPQCVIDNEVELSPMGIPKTEEGKLDGNTVNIVEAIMWAVNSALKANWAAGPDLLAPGDPGYPAIPEGNLARADGFGYPQCVAYQLDDGRLTLAFGLPTSFMDGHAGGMLPGNIDSVYFQLSDEVALMWGMKLYDDKDIAHSPSYRTLTPDNLDDDIVDTPWGFPNEPRPGPPPDPADPGYAAWQEVRYDVLGRGSMTIGWNRRGGDGRTIHLVRFLRPMKPRGPSFVYLQMHTASVKSRSLSFVDERAVWALQIQDALWVSSRSNQGTRRIITPAFDDAVPPAPIVPPTEQEIKDALKDFYPENLEYYPSQVPNPDPTLNGNTTHNFSWMNPNYAYVKTERVTFQDIEFTLYNGDTMKRLYAVGGAGTQISLIMSP